MKAKQRRAQRGQGAVYHRPDGYWIASRQIDGVRHTASAKTSAEAQRRLKAKLTPTPTAPVSLSLEAFLPIGSNRRSLIGSAQQRGHATRA
jgi:hypothetical protein